MPAALRAQERPARNCFCAAPCVGRRATSACSRGTNAVYWVLLLPSAEPQGSPFAGAAPELQQWALRGGQPARAGAGSTDPSAMQDSARPTARPAQRLPRHLLLRLLALPGICHWGRTDRRRSRDTLRVRPGPGRGASTDGGARQGAELPGAGQAPGAAAAPGTRMSQGRPVAISSASSDGPKLPAMGSPKERVGRVLPAPRIPRPHRSHGGCSQGSGGGAARQRRAGRGRGVPLTSDLLSRRGSSSR